MKTGRKLGHSVSEVTREKLRVFNLGKSHSKETKQKMSDSHKGRKPYEMTPEIRKKISITISKRVGSLSPNWKGGISKTKEYQNFHIRLNKARRRGAEGKYTIGEWNDLLKKHNYKCLFCGRGLPEVKVTVDHIIPISKGGTNDISNIQPLCMSCNRRKSDKVLSTEVATPLMPQSCVKVG